MKRVIIITTLVFSGCLLVFSQALASGQSSKTGAMQGERSPIATQAGDQVQQHLAIQQLNREQTREMQRLLNDQGYAIGNMDGEMNQETTEAIRQFQKTEGLAVTGQPNQETLRALAPSSDQQEFFGLSPEFGEMEEN